MRFIYSRLVSVLVSALCVSLVTAGTARADSEHAQDVVIGAEPVYFGQDLCFTGLSVEHADLGHGFVTSDGCGTVGDEVSRSRGGEVIGVVRLQLPGWLWVQLTEGWSAEPYVAPDHPVVGAEPPPMGQSVCRSSPVQGRQCGQITATDRTVNLPQGTVAGVTQTNLCADAAFGGPYLADGHAQGVHLAGNGNCSAGVDYFYPIQRILDVAPQLSLMTVQ